MQRVEELMADRTGGQEVDGATHLSRDSRVQIAPKLLEVCVRWVFHLESLLWATIERR